MDNLSRFEYLIEKAESSSVNLIAIIRDINSSYIASLKEVIDENDELKIKIARMEDNT